MSFSCDDVAVAVVVAGQLLLWVMMQVTGPRPCRVAGAGADGKCGGGVYGIIELLESVMVVVVMVVAVLVSEAAARRAGRQRAGHVAATDGRVCLVTF